MFKNALVTGGCGFVGRHFCKRLIADGWRVTCVDSLASEGALAPDRWPEHLRCDGCEHFRFVQMDCCDFFNREGTDGGATGWGLVIHLAAIVGGRENMERHPMSVAEDLSIDSRMFIWACKRRERIGHVVYFSSSAAYPIQHQQDDGCARLLHEDMIDFGAPALGMADLTYGWSKLTGEYLAQTAASMYGLRVACYRPFSGYGEDQHEVYPFPSILRRVLRKESPVTIWSDAVRDFVHIDDIVDGVLTTYPSLTTGHAINLGSGIPTSFSDLARLMMEVAGHEADVVILGEKPKGVHSRVADTANATALGFRPRIDIRTGVQKIIAYMVATHQTVVTSHPSSVEGASNRL